MNNIYLIGFMGSGKTTIGSLLSDRLGRRFIDTDRLIEERLKKPVALIIEEMGESKFREIETDALASAASQYGCIVATGGGIIKSPGNLELMKRTGAVIYLSASPAEILRRVGDGRGRPLLKAPDIAARIADLLSEREDAYSQADYKVITDGRSIDDILSEISILAEGWAAMGVAREHKIQVAVNTGAYQVSVRPGIISEAGHRIRELGLTGKVLIISNPTVYSHYGVRLERALERAGVEKTVFQMPDGEEFKNLNIVSCVWEKALDLGLDRKSLIISLGGGVVCDLAGFAAAAYMRGIDVIHIPTTLLAQVDASVGGKVAVNLPKGKNIVGAFWQPRSVLIDPVTLATLDHREIRSGIAEIIKHGAALDRALFDWLSSNHEKVADGSPELWAELISWNVRLKAEVVSKDEKERGLRAVLNFGHTIGHALESLTNYSTFRHGEAVAIGMACASQISACLGLLPESDYKCLVELLAVYGLQTEIPGIEADLILEVIKRDKKSESGDVKWILLNALGSAEIIKISDEKLLKECLRRLGAR